MYLEAVLSDEQDPSLAQDEDSHARTEIRDEVLLAKGAEIGRKLVNAEIGIAVDRSPGPEAG